MMSDALLISAHKAGDEHAISLLMDRHKDSLMGFLVNRVGLDADDLYQETWVRVSTSISNYDERGSFRSWLFQIARRLVIDHHRRSRSRILLVHTNDDPANQVPDGTLPDQDLEAADLAKAFHQAMDLMETPMREVVHWRLFDGLSFKEIAERQNVPLNTALGRMHRALKQIRKSLTDKQIMDKGPKQ